MTTFCRFIFSYSSYYNQAFPGYGLLRDLWRDIALSFEEQGREVCCQQRKHSGPVTIATLPLNQYKPEEISLDVDGENITLHGQHRSERQDGFENSEFKKIIKLPEDVDPTTVTSRVSKDDSFLVLEGVKRVEEKTKTDDDKFVVTLNLRGFKPEEIKVQLRGHELTVTGKHRAEEDGSYLSRDYSRRVLLPDDAELSSVTSRLSKEGLLTIEVARDPALLPSERNVELSMEVDHQQHPEEEEEKKEEEKGASGNRED